MRILTNKKSRRLQSQDTQQWQPTQLPVKKHTAHLSIFQDSLESNSENCAKIITCKIKITVWFLRNLMCRLFHFPFYFLRFSVVIEGERGNRPRIYSLEQLLQEAVSFTLEVPEHLLYSVVLWVVVRCWVALTESPHALYREFCDFFSRCWTCDPRQRPS